MAERSPAGRGGAARFVGASVQRGEDLRLLRGQGLFVDDVRLPGMLHAAFVRSPLAHARVVGVMTEAARRARGVVAVFDGEEMARIARPRGSIPGSADGEGPPVYTLLATDKVRLVGDPVALVVAESRYLAEDACELVEVRYEALPAVMSAEQALDPKSPPIFEDLGRNVIYGPTTKVYGDVPGTFASADLVVQAKISQHRQQNVPMEGRGIVASFDPKTGELLVHAATQGVNTTREALAAQLGLAAEKVRVLAGDIGGSFGLKFGISREEVACAAASRALGRPVRWIEDRGENLTVSGQAREESFEVEAAVTREGEILGMRVQMVIDAGAYPGLAPAVVDTVREMIPGPYRLRALEFSATVAVTNKASYVAYRGPWAAETFVRERMVDLVAAELGLDPLEVRLRNVARRGEPPLRMVTGPPLAGITARESLERMAELIDLPEFRRRQAAARQEGRYLGVGFATYIEPAPGPRSPDSTPDPGELEHQRMRLEADGTLSVFTAQMPHGQGHQTTLAQIAADQFGVDWEQVQVVVGDSSLSPEGFGTGGSRFATMAGGATLHAARELRSKVLEVAAQLLDTGPEQLAIVRGLVVGVGAPAGGLPLAELAAAAERGSLPVGTDSRLEVEVTFDGGEAGWSGGTHCALVEVDCDTGMVRVDRYLVVEDCGEMINPAIVEGQVRGGVAQGLGAVLLERSAYDPDGQYLSGSFMDYLLPTATDVPHIEIEHLETVRLDPDVNFRGVGEGGMIVAPPTLCNAIADALAPLGARITEQHLPPSRLLELIGKISG
ncbi:MAG: xanthine dehydrogenase family protein molybdopterin-binding subunit [Candidatus Dormiibacterota bacterium]